MKRLLHYCIYYDNGLIRYRWIGAILLLSMVLSPSFTFAGAEVATATSNRTEINPNTLSDVSGGTITTEDSTLLCVSDGPVEINFLVDGAQGENMKWLFADLGGTIFGIQDQASFTFSTFGQCEVYHISFDNTIVLERGMNVSDLQGDFDLSNKIDITRRKVSAGEIVGGPFEFTVDGTPDMVSGLSLAGNRTGTNSSWVVTDSEGKILGLPPTLAALEGVDFDEAGPGTCLIWYLSFEDGLQGAEVGLNANDLQGCFDLSDPVSVVRTGSGVLDGGTVSGGPYVFCVDGEPDNVMGVGLEGAVGPKMQYVVTDDQGNILGLPPTPEAVNFDDAGPGVCYIWNLSYEGEINGLEPGENVSDLSGNFDLSDNFVMVTRNQPEGGTVSGGPYEFVVDGEPDNVMGVELKDASGANSQYVVTDQEGKILGLPPTPEAVNFDDAGPGVCYIWHLSYDGEIDGLAAGNNISEVTGCFDLSDNFVTVTRTAGDAVLDGGTVSGGPYVFCVDGEPDNVMGVGLEGAVGPKMQYVVTDDQGNILGLPPTPEAVNFDDAGPGVCYIWNLSYEGEINGLEPGENVSGLSGNFDLSDNFVMVTRNQPEGGTVSGGPYEFVVDGEPDNVMGVELKDASGANSQYVVTDQEGKILGLPPTPEAVNFDDAGPGVCYIWHLSYDGEIDGLAAGNNISEVTGCFDLSDNFVTVTRTAGDAVLDGGTVSGGPYVFCVDGEPDNVMGVGLEGAVGPKMQYVVTDDQGNILGLPPTPEAVNFDDAGPGVCYIWNLSYEGEINGLEPGENVSGLSGNFDLSDNFVMVTRNQPEGGTVSGGPYEFVVDGEPDNVMGVELKDASGANSQYVVTDQEGKILGLPPTPEAVNFDDAGPGVCYIWHLSYDGEIDGLAAGNNISEVTGCFDLSDNFVTVTRTAGDAVLDGGTVSGGPYVFCVDGEPDNVMGVGLEGAVGPKMQYVVTDDQGNILGLPPTPEAVNFDDAGPGVCYIWNLSYEGEINGLEPGENVSDLSGNFDLSDNFVMVTRNQPEGGTVSGGPYEFVVDGEPDNVMGVELKDASGANSQYVVTDQEGKILGLPPTPEAVNFDDAGPGVCYIWHLSYDGEIDGLAAGNNISEVTGCFDLSDNFVTVTRTAGDAVLDGGTVSGGPYVFCVDGEPDNVMGVGLEGAVGPKMQYVVTDDQGNILGLPPTPEAVNFDDAGPGVCYIWNLSYEGEINGLEPGENVSDLSGNFDLSDNFVMVTRNQPEGGTVSGGPYEFVVDGEPDNVMGVELKDASGANSQYVVTDQEGKILGLPPTPEAVNFDDAGPGVCYIWHLSYDGEIDGLAAGNNISEVTGCFDLSDNFVTVTRTAGDAVLDGGTVSGGPYVFCVDGEPDNVMGVGLEGAVGPKMQYVVTDDQGNILGLPPTPEAVNFDDAGPGVCYIWNLSYEGEINGLEPGENVSDLSGNFDLSDNFVMVTRNQPEGGTVSGGPYEFVVDGEPDNVMGVELKDASGANSQYVVTDQEGKILGLPPTPEAVNFDDAGPGVCYIWHLSYDGEIDGLAAGNNISEVTGCFDLSDNFVTVTRVENSSGKTKVSLFPNPSSDKLTISVGSTDITKIRIKLFDFGGNDITAKMRRDSEDVLSFDVSAIPAGIYLVRVNDGSTISTKKVIIR